MHMAKKLLAERVTIIQKFLFNCIGLTGRPARTASTKGPEDRYAGEAESI